MGEPCGVEVSIVVPNSWRDPEARTPWNADYDRWPNVIGIIGGYLGSYFSDDAVGDRFTRIDINGEADYGLSGSDMREMLDELTKLRIPWECYGEGKYDWPAEYQMYDGNAEGKVFAGQPSGNGGPQVMTEGEWLAINQGVHEWAKTHWEFFHQQPQLPDEPVWLLDMPHPDDEDAVDDERAVL